MFTTRRKNYSIIKGGSIDTERHDYTQIQDLLSGNGHTHPSLPTSSDSYPPPPNLSPTLSLHDEIERVYPVKHRRIFGIWTIRTPNSSRFADNFHSRILVKFPFLVEMYYWAISFYLYRLTGLMAQIHYGGTQGLWDAAQGHGIAILNLESWFLGLNQAVGKDRWAEYRIQQWYLTGADGGDFRGLWLTILDRGYSLIHIPGTVGYDLFSSWGHSQCFYFLALVSPY